jgi:hypothetical protein
MFEGVPTMYIYMLAHLDFDRYDLTFAYPLHRGRADGADSENAGGRASFRLPAHRAVQYDRNRWVENDVPLLRPFDRRGPSFWSKAVSHFARRFPEWRL